MPLSGVNSRHGPGDVIIPENYSLVIECKFRNSFLHHRLFRDAVEDAQRYGIDPKRVLLYTREKNRHGDLVVLDADMLDEILSVPAARQKFWKSS
jgi:hypothetical protein